MKIEDLTGKELRDIETVTGSTLMAGLTGAEDSGNFDAAFAFVWITRRRSDPSLTFDQVLDDTTFADAMAAMAAGEGTDPGKGNSGTTLPSSAAIGR